MSKKSEKSGLSHQELTKHLDESSTAIREQQEEMQRIQSGTSEKMGFPNSLGCDSSVGIDPSKMASMSSEASFLHTPPPSYFDRSIPPPDTSSHNKSTKIELTDSFQARLNTGDYRNLLIKDLRFETRRQLGLHLDLEHPNVKNWKNLADEIGFSNLEIQNFDNGINKTQRVLNEAEVRYSDMTVGNLCEILEDIDRHDVLTDIEPLFVKDMSKPRRKFGSGTSIASNSGTYSFPTASPSLWNRDFSILQEAALFQSAQPPPPFANTGQGDRQVSLSGVTTVSPATSIPVQVDNVTTTDNPPATERRMQSLNEKGSYPMASPQNHPISLPPDYDYPAPQRYDAFVMYDVADKEFILSEFLPKVETAAGLKLFIPGRDSPAGDHHYDAQLEAMMTSCPKLIVIQSDEFLRSTMSRWSLNIALALDPAARRRKIIPVVYKRVTEPSILAGINACDRTRVLEDSWFWDGIIRSLKQNR